MLHILWIILRTILIIVGVVVALVLLALLLVLFCPFCYSAGGSTSPSLEGQVKLSWLFHGVTLTLGYHDRKSEFQVRIFGVRLRRFNGLLNRFRNQSSRGQGRTGPPPPPASESVRTAPEPTMQTVKPEEPEGPDRQALTAPQPAGEEEQKEQKKPSRIRRLFQRIGAFFRKLAERIGGVFRWIGKLPGKISQFFQRISHTLHNLRSFIDRWRRFFEDAKVQAGISSAWQTLKKLVAHLKPRKIKGRILFGFSNPATTGEVLAVIGATCPIHKNVLTVVPDFENQVFEGELLIKGRVYLFVVLYQALHLYRDKNFQYLMRQARQKEG